MARGWRGLPLAPRSCQCGSWAVVVAAAGNRSSDAAQFSPANCAGVVAVAAVNRQGGRASYSNYGTVVSLAAPGGDGSDGILSTINTDYYKVLLPGGKTLTASLLPMTKSNYDLYVYRSDGSPWASSTAGLRQLDMASVTNTAVGSTRVYVRVVYLSGQTGSTGRYFLALED